MSKNEERKPLTTPYVYIDLDKVEKNIKNMTERLANAGIAHRPHIKTHKSIELAKKQIEMGSVGITVAKLAEAEVMNEAGINDIFIAYPIVGEQNLLRLKALCSSSQIRTIVDSYTIASGISSVGESLNKKIEVLIEIDGGSHRGGVQPGEATLDFAKSIADLPGIKIVGLFVYSGQVYGEKDHSGIKKKSQEEAEILINTQQLLNQNGFDIQITSGGSTPSSFFASDLEGITESRAGNYIFCDMNAVHLGVADMNECALKICSTVVSTPLPGYATIDAGSKTITSDLSVKGDTYGTIYGKEGVKLVKLNEEHGYLRFDPSVYQFKVGDVVEIIPNHSCVVPNLNDKIYAFRNGTFEREIRIDARGANY